MNNNLVDADYDVLQFIMDNGQEIMNGNYLGLPENVLYQNFGQPVVDGLKAKGVLKRTKSGILAVSVDFLNSLMDEADSFEDDSFEQPNQNEFGQPVQQPNQNQFGQPVGNNFNQPTQQPTFNQPNMMNQGPSVGPSTPNGVAPNVQGPTSQVEDSILDDEDEVEDVSKVVMILPYVGAVLGLLGVIFGFITKGSIIGVLLAAVGLIVAFVGLAMGKQYEDNIYKKHNIIGLVLSILMVLLAGVSMFLGMSSQPTAQQKVEQKQAEIQKKSAKKAKQDAKNAGKNLAENIHVKYDDFTKSVDKYGVLTTGLKVTIRNVSEKPINYNMIVQPYRDGQPLGDPDYLLMIRLEPGKSVTRTLFDTISDEDLANKLADSKTEFKLDNVSLVDESSK